MANHTQTFSANDITTAIKEMRYITVRMIDPVDLDGNRWISLSFSQDLCDQMRALNRSYNVSLGINLLPVMVILEGSNELAIPYVILNGTQTSLPTVKRNVTTVTEILQEYADCIADLALPNQASNPGSVRTARQERMNNVLERAANIELSKHCMDKTLLGIAKTPQSSVPLLPTKCGPTPLRVPPLEVLQGGKPTNPNDVQEYTGIVSAVDTTLDILVIDGRFAVVDARKIWSTLPKVGTPITVRGRPSGEIRLDLVRVTKDPQQLPLAPLEVIEEGDVEPNNQHVGTLSSRTRRPQRLTG